MPHDAQRIRIVHITDTHHTEGDPRLALAVDAILALDPLPDLVVHGGDVVHGYTTPDAHDAQMAEAASILARLPMPVRVICCNHDTHGEGVRGRCFARHFHSEWMQEWVTESWAVLVLSGCVDIPGNLPIQGDEEDGEGEPLPYRVGQTWSLRLLETWLRKHADKRCLVFSHVPVFHLRGSLQRADPDGKPPPASFDRVYALPHDEADAVHSILRDGNALAHYAGHVHFNGCLLRDGVRYVSTSAVQSYPGELRILDGEGTSLRHWMHPVEGGRELWVRWKNVIDPAHPDVHLFYDGVPEERDFTIPIPEAKAPPLD